MNYEQVSIAGIFNENIKNLGAQDPSCVQIITGKFILDLKYNNNSLGGDIYLFDREGRMVGEVKCAHSITLLRRLSSKVENMIFKKCLRSTLFGSISLKEV
jgi:hypothetical protein